MQSIAKYSLGLVILLAALGGAGAARAQTAGVTGNLYGPSGASLGTATVGTDGLGNTVIAIALTGAQPLSTYAVCLTSPVGQQLSGACSPSNAFIGGSIFGTPGFGTPGFGTAGFGFCPASAFGLPCGGAQSTVQASFSTDAQGHALATISSPGILSVAVVVIWNVANPADWAQAVVVTGLSGAGFACPPGVC